MDERVEGIEEIVVEKDDNVVAEGVSEKGVVVELVEELTNDEELP